ncbi:SDR family oxidoreductase [Nocardia sp. NPDC051750]|uniref:SDR family oxidoreductase n=1 Tax=Nocardia sp. NPDC051750 TaxID=3364325 RepID=UPI0037B41B4D
MISIGTSRSRSSRLRTARVVDSNSSTDRSNSLGTADSFTNSRHRHPRPDIAWYRRSLGKILRAAPSAQLPAPGAGPAEGRYRGHHHTPRIGGYGRREETPHRGQHARAAEPFPPGVRGAGRRGDRRCRGDGGHDRPGLPADPADGAAAGGRPGRPLHRESRRGHRRDSGIGEATVRAFAAEGASVVFCGRREDLGRGIERSLGRAVRYVRADVRVPDEVAGLFGTAVLPPALAGRTPCAAGRLSRDPAAPRRGGRTQRGALSAGGPTGRKGADRPRAARYRRPPGIGDPGARRHGTPPARTGPGPDSTVAR